MRRVVLVLLLSACGPTVPQLDETSCPECSIELEHVVTLDMKDAAGSPTPASTLVRLADGSWALTWTRAGLLRFEPDGRYRGVMLRTGEGPGEEKFISTAWAAGDTLWVWDAGNQRCSAFVADTLAAERECVGARAHDVVVVPDGIIVRGPPAEGVLPMRFIDHAGNAVTFGPDTLTPDRDIGSLAPASEGVWWNQSVAYEFEWWVPGEDSARRVIRRRPSWWRLYAEGLPERPTDPNGPVPVALAGPRVSSIWQSGGILWTASYSTFDPQLSANEWIAMQTAGSTYSFIEAMTTDGRLLAGRVDSLGITRFTNDGLLFASEIAPEGHVNLGVYRPRLILHRDGHTH